MWLEKADPVASMEIARGRRSGDEGTARRDHGVGWERNGSVTGIGSRSDPDRRWRRNGLRWGTFEWPDLNAALRRGERDGRLKIGEKPRALAQGGRRMDCRWAFT